MTNEIEQGAVQKVLTEEQLKNKRKTAKSYFTRHVTKIKQLIDGCGSRTELKFNRTLLEEYFEECRQTNDKYQTCKKLTEEKVAKSKEWTVAVEKVTLEVLETIN